MVIRLISLTIAACVGLIYLLSVMAPDDTLFYVISSDRLANISRVLLAAGMIYIAFRPRFGNVLHQTAVGILAIILVAFGVMGVFNDLIAYHLYDKFRTLDYLLAMQAGSVFGLAALSYKHGEPQLSLPEAIDREVSVQKARLRQIKVQTVHAAHIAAHRIPVRKPGEEKRLPSVPAGRQAQPR